MEENKNILTEENKNIVPTNEKPNQQPVKSNKGLIAFLIIIILLLAAALVYFVFFNKDKEEPKKENNTQETENKEEEQKEEEQKEEEQKEQETEETKGNYNLDVYVTNDGMYSYIYDSPTENSTKVSVKVESDKAKYLSSSYDSTSNFFLYDDNGVKLYDIKNKKSTSLDIKNNYKDYYIHMSEDEKSVIGVSYTDSKGMGTYYNMKTKKEMYKGKYKLAEDKRIINTNDKYISVPTKEKSYLLSTESEKVIMSCKNDTESYWKHYYNSYGENGKYFYTLETWYDDGVEIEKVYNNNLEEFLSIMISNEEFYNVYKNNLYINDKNTVKKYNTDGKLLSSKSYDEVMSIVNNYIIYVKNGSLYLENFDDPTETKEICSWNKEWDFDFARYYDRKTLDYMDEKNKKEGLYVVFYYGYDDEGHGIKDGKGYYGMEYCYTTDKQIADYPIKEEMGGRAKPVLYLYPEEETNVTVKFEKPNLLTTTYPKYINSWNVTVKPNGDMYDKDGKYYYALYWDEKRYNEVDFKEGFYVEGKDAINFLEEKLTYIGLNDKERNEFIMYWLPIMESNKKNLVYFELTEERETGNKLFIEPKPDSLLRISIHIKKVNEKVNIPEQKLETFARVGFTAVEWGGMTY